MKWLNSVTFGEQAVTENTRTDRTPDNDGGLDWGLDNERVRGSSLLAFFILCPSLPPYTSPLSKQH